MTDQGRRHNGKTTCKKEHRVVIGIEDVECGRGGEKP